MTEWVCDICNCENSELADSCAECGSVHVTASCCDQRRPERRMHIVELGQPPVCADCMSVDDYHKRIDRIANVFEGNAWVTKHTDELQERPQDFIEEVINRFYDHHMALQDVKRGA